MNFAQIILLKEGTDQSQGKAQCISNINACLHVADVVRTTLGPLGMDKLIHMNRETTISNDGATIMKLLEIQHPAAKTLVDIAKSQDAEVGDGTTSVVVLAAEFLREAKQHIEDGVAPQVIIKAFRHALQMALQKLQEIAIVPQGNQTEQLQRCAKTALTSKLIASQGDFFATMVVTAIEKLDESLDLSLIGIKKVQGGAMTDSFLVDGVAFKKTFSYAGFEQQPKKLVKPKILCLNLELELKAEKDNAEIRLKDPEQYQAIVDAEWEIIYDKLANCVKAGANIILSKLAIGDLATQYFADRGLFCAGRVADEDMKRVCKATGAAVQTTVTNLAADSEVFGTCELFEERQVGSERHNLFTGCPRAKTATIVVRGGAEQFIEETERSLHDALMIVKRAKQHNSVVAGGGAIEMELSKYLREYAHTIKGKQQLVVNSYARALEVIPRQLSENAGLDATDVLNRLRKAHHTMPNGTGVNYGVDVNSQEGVCDTFASYVWEPVIVRRNALSSATEAACLILSIDETITNPKSEAGGNDEVPVGGRPRTGGRGMAGMMGGAQGVRKLAGRGGR
eukprot:TRINITY_DN1399_c0_g1_i1.p1 TRINITY_DN1399_c0_g1~~TRINITY_DN1399_c0_g1_i1.p1  ORF type:complete len:568 (+),score=114.46 TRINITY_DN1399_c0_g1_i1:1395-3098(+)